MLDKIWEVLTTFTDEAQNAVRAKCNELGFNPDRGIISLEESFINLNTVKLILIDAIEKQKLIQLPITIQNTLLNSLNSIVKFQTDIINGSDSIVNLVSAIEQLNTAMWQYGLYNLSEEVLGYQTKMNQLKNQELEIKKLKDEIKRSLALKSILEKLVADAQKSIETIQTFVVSSEESKNKISGNEKITDEILQKANEILSMIQKAEVEAKNTVSAIGILGEDSNNWAEDIKKLSKKSEELAKTITEQQKELKDIIELSEQTHKQIENLLPGATSAGLASAFEQRKKEVAKSEKYWILGFICSLVGLMFMLVWMIKIFPEHNEDIKWWMFILQRAPLTFPLIWLSWFFGRNYGHTVRLKEDYAFKESISRAFEGYKKQMQEVDPGGALPQLCVNTISILSEAPLRVFDRKTSDETPANSLLEKVMPKKKNSQE